MQSGVTHVELKALHDHGWSPTQLAREFGLSRTTIYKELASPGPRVYGPRPAPFAVGHGLRRNVSDSAPPLFLCQG